MATKLLQVYKCDLCGNIVMMTHAGAGQLVCCGKPMTLQEENTTDAAQEKHVPVLEKTETGYKVSVGSTLHPMVEDHYIEWIDLIDGDQVYHHFLKPGEEPVATFPVTSDGVTARAYCNLHGLWKG